MHRNIAIITNALLLTMVGLTFLYSTIGTSSSIISSIRTAYAGALEESLHEGLLNLSNSEGDSITSVMAASGNNNIYVAWIDDTPGYKAVFLARSIDGGTSFSNATILSNNNSKTSSYPEEPQIAVSGSNVYMAWYDNMTGNFDAFIAVSTDNGTSFSNPISLKEKAGVQNKDASDEYGLITSFSQISASRNNLYVIWYDNITGSIETFLTKSTDNGISFSDPINLSQKAKVGTMRNIAASGNNVYVLSTIRGDVNTNLTNNTASNIQLLLSKSTDGGITFSEPVMVTNEEGISGPPRLAVSGNNTVYVSWKDDTVEESETKGIMRILSNKISLTKSTDGGITFSQPVTVIESKSSIDSDFNIGATGNNVYAVWSMDVGGGEFIPGLGRLPEEHIFAAKSTDGGTTFKKPPIDVGTGRFPDVAVSADNDNWYVIWGYNIGNSEIFFTKVTGSQSQLTDTVIGTTGANTRDAAVTSGSLAVSIEMANDPIRRGLQQIAAMTIEDKNTKEKIAGANVSGEVTFRSGSNIVERFSGISDNSGQISHRWAIGEETYGPGRYEVKVHVSAEGYNPTSFSTIFRVE